jgi:hypothetical protein
LADGKDGTLEAKLDVKDVISAPIVEPPQEMEFRPAECKGQPNKKNHAVLYVNLQVVPLGRKIEISILKSQGSISLLGEGEKKCTETSVRVEKENQLEGTTVARLLVPWFGGGWGSLRKLGQRPNYRRER